MKRLRQDTLSEKIHRYRGVIFVISTPLVLISFVLLIMPRTTVDVSSLSQDPFERSTVNKLGRPAGSKTYVIVFDAGSSGSRVHVFSFSKSFKLQPIGNEMEFFDQKKPGLSAYASNPKQGANSLRSLLDEALKVVPEDFHPTTPVRLGATAGLRTLPGESANNLINEVKDLFRQSSLKFSPSWVNILDGSQEGTFGWVTVNYLLGNIGKVYGETVGIVDLGGGSVQMAYAVSKEDAQNAPKTADGEDVYVKVLHLLGRTYYLYVNSYLHYGLLAARAEIFKLVEGTGNPCVAKGFQGEYTYGPDRFKVVGEASGPDINKCKKLAIKALNKYHSCTHMKCTFGGVWNGGGGDGQKKLFVASFFFDRAAEAGIIYNPNASEAKVKASDFETVSRSVCATSYADIGEKYPMVEEDQRGYFCLDLVYEYTLLVEGFDLDPKQDITLVKRVKYENSFVEAAWPLGSAIELIS
eukprot:c20029_g1_i1 orf=615-2018(-)